MVRSRAIHICELSGRDGLSIAGRDFPVDQVQRPLVLASPRALVKQGFKTEEAKLAFVEGATESSIAMPVPCKENSLVRIGLADRGAYIRC